MTDKIGFVEQCHWKVFSALPNIIPFPEAQLPTNFGQVLGHTILRAKSDDKKKTVTVPWLYILEKAITYWDKDGSL